MIQRLKKEDIQLKDWEFEFQQRGEQPISLCDFFCRSLDAELILQVSGKAQHCDYLFTDSDKGYNNPRYKQYVAQMLKEKTDDRLARKLVIKNSMEIPRSFNAVADVLTKEINKKAIPNEKLAHYWKEMDAAFLKVIPWFYYPYYISKENYLTDSVKAGLETYREKIEDVCDFDEAFLAVVFPIKKTGFQLEQEDMLGLVTIAEQTSDFPNDAHFKTMATKYLKKFDWLTTFILTPLLPMTYEQLIERVQRAVGESFRESFALQKQATQKNEGVAKQVLEIVHGDTNLLEDIADARELGYVLTAGIEEAYMSSARYLPFIQLVAKRIGVSFEETKYLMSEEILTALMNHANIPATLINERKHGFVMMMKSGKQSALFGAEGHKISLWIDEELNKVDERISELRGQVACKGFATGKVRIASQPSQAHLLKEEEILVCPMTNPDYVAAMRRSAAIVTDEGGMLSHAAIMSRELNRPCIVGTKIATKLLKNGDVVEVDADRGVVKILEN